MPGLQEKLRGRSGERDTDLLGKKAFADDRHTFAGWTAWMLT